ncbi:MAG: EAL domain-containing response regulator [Pseudohongiellaceae bacterium]
MNNKNAMYQLIVLDDETTVGQTIAHIARSESFQTRVTTSEASFFTTLEECAPTCIILDLIMPEHDGIQIINRLANQNCEVNLLILSGADQRVINTVVNVAVARGLNVIGKLQKPFTAEALRHYLKLSVTRQDTIKPPSNDLPSPQLPGISPEMIKHALENNEFSLRYQPQVHCGNGELVGFEALSRWQLPGHGYISPDLFIPVIEDNGLMPVFTLQITRNALHWFSQTIDRYPAAVENLSLSINVSARNLTDRQFATDIRALCTECGVPPGRVILELTESQALSDIILSSELLAQLRIHGFRISIDDFGSGHSSLIQLARLPFSEIKIDRAFVSNAMESEESRNIIRSIISLGKSLGLKSVAEGVEDSGTLNLLRDSGCDYAQGYHINHPLDPEAAAQLIGAGLVD